MKKIYIQPQMEEVMAETVGLLAVSVEGFSEVLDENGISGDEMLSPSLDIDILLSE